MLENMHLMMVMMMVTGNLKKLVILKADQNRLFRLPSAIAQCV